MSSRSQFAGLRSQENQRIAEVKRALGPFFSGINAPYSLWVPPSPGLLGIMDWMLIGIQNLDAKKPIYKV